MVSKPIGSGSATLELVDTRGFAKACNCGNMGGVSLIICFTCMSVEENAYVPYLREHCLQNGHPFTFYRADAANAILHGP